jgi:hypothetical protein
MKGVQAIGEPSAIRRVHLVLQNMKFHHFFIFFVGYFAVLDPDPATKIKANTCESGLRTFTTIVNIGLRAHHLGLG